MASILTQTYGSNLTQVVESVFETMLDLAVEPAETTWAAESDRVTSIVYFVGAWSGAVILETGPAQACFFSQRLFSAGQPSIIDDDVRDSLAELANMLAGNLKSVLPRGVTLSVPSVVEGSDYTLRICGGNMVERLGFSSPSGAFWITLVEIPPLQQPE